MKVFLASVVTRLVATGPAVYSQSSLRLLPNGGVNTGAARLALNLIIPIKDH